MGDRPYILPEGLRPVEKLGSGATATTFAVCREGSGDLLALKLARPDLSEEERLRFRKEFYVLHSLRHPHLPTAHEMGTTPEGRLFFTMDFVQGEPINAVFRGFSRQLGLVALQVGQALDYLHTRGYLHNDLKPDHIRVRRTGEEYTSTLVDLGYLCDQRQRGVEDGAGTLEYLAPEKLKGQAPDERSDLYSLGAVLYEVITGCPVIRGDDTLGILRGLLSHGIVPPRHHCPQLPPGLEEVLLKLLAPDPDHRYSSAREVAEVLAWAWGLPPPALAGLEGKVRLPRGTLTGREEILRDLEESVGKWAKESGFIFIIQGDSGVGKTRLLQEFCGRCSVEGKWDVYLVSCAREESITVWLQDLRSVARGETCPNGSAQDDCQGLAALGKNPPVDARNLIVRAACERKLRGRPVVLLLDDLDRATPLGLTVLRDLLGDLRSVPLFAVVTHERDIPFSILCEQTRSVALPLLTGQEVASLVGSILPGFRDGEDLARWLHERTSGNPSHLIGTLDLLAERGDLLRDQGGWRASSLLDKGAIPPTTADLFHRKLEVTSAEEQEVAETAAMIGEVFPLVLLERVLGWNDERLFGVLHGLEEHGVLTQVPGAKERYTFLPRALSDHLRERLTPEERKRLHWRIAQTQVSLVSEGWPQASGEVAVHLLAAGKADLAHPYVLKSSQEARERFDYWRASNLLKELLDAEPSGLNGAERGTLEEERGDLEELRGDLVSALGCFERAAAYLPSVEDQVRILRKVASVKEDLGDVAGSVQLLEEVLLLVGNDPSRDLTRVHLALSWSHLNLGDYDTAAGLTRRVLASAREKGWKKEEGQSLLHLATIHQRQSNVDLAIREAEAALEVSAAAGDHALLQVAYGHLGILNYERRDYARARECFDKAREIAEQRQDLSGLANVCNNLGLVEMDSFRYREAATLFEQGLGLAHRLADQTAIGYFLLNLGQVYERVGEWNRSYDFTQRALGMLRKVGNSSRVALCHHNLGCLAAERGDYETAMTHLRESLEMRQQLKELVEVAQSGLALADLCIREKTWEDAEQYLTLSLRSSRRGRGERVQAALLRAKGEILIGLGKVRSARATLSRSRRLASECQNLSEFCAASRALATLELSTGDIPAALILAEEALAVGRRIGLALELLRSLLLVSSVRLEQIKHGRGFGPAEARERVLEPAREAREIASRLGAQRELQESLYREAEVADLLCSTSSPLVARGEGHLTTLRRAAELVGCMGSGEDVFSRVLDLAIGELGADRGALFLFGSAGTDLELVAGRGVDRQTLADSSRLSRSVLQQVGEEKRPLICVDAQSDRKLRRRQSVIVNQIRSLVCVPLIHRKGALGALYLDSCGAKTVFARRDADFLMALASFLAAAIELARLSQLLREENLDLRGEVARTLAERQIIGESPEMKEMYLMIAKAAAADANILIEGESGTGKELVARAIHRAGLRRDYPFMPIDCGALAETLLEGELFGYLKGAFTGADRNKKGLFAEADGGTVFLDEIASASPSAQARLLRFLEEGQFRPLGGTRYLKSDVRVICATNRDLEVEVEDRKFRSDLYYRLRVVQINIPPLRDRGQDIVLLANHFLRVFSSHAGKRTAGLEPEVMRAFLEYPWPGNVRELENCVERAVALADEPVIGLEDVDPRVLKGRGVVRKQKLRELQGSIELDRLLVALAASGGNVTKTALLLGITRRQVQRLIQKHGLDKAKFKGARHAPRSN